MEQKLSLAAKVGLSMSVLVSAIAIAIGVVGLAGNLDKGGMCVYYSLITGTVALWSPSPASKFFNK